jgi:hypothetical protein
MPQQHPTHEPSTGPAKAKVVGSRPVSRSKVNLRTFPPTDCPEPFTTIGR